MGYVKGMTYDVLHTERLSELERTSVTDNEFGASNMLHLLVDH